MIKLKLAVISALLCLAIAHEACFDLTGPIADTNSFCPEYSGNTCCSVAADTDIQTTVNALGITDQACLAFVTKTSCSYCDPWAAHLYGVEDTNTKTFPELCTDYCNGFYTACASVEMNWPEGKNPFQVSTKRIIDSFPTQQDFCSYYGPLSDDTACYNGTKFIPKSAPAVPPGSDELCLEYFAFSDGSQAKALKLVSPHDGSERIFIAYQNGSVMVLNQTTGAYIDMLLSVNTIDNGESGLIGLVAHPKFAENGLVYIYYTAPKKATCVDDDWCNGNTCDTQTNTCNAAYFLGTNLLQEFKVPTGSNVADPTPVRTLMEIAKPYNNHNGGDLTFGSDGFLYFGTGDGGLSNDPFDNAQNLNRRLGKILRIDVDSTSYVSGRQYAVPSDNPYLDSKFPEIYASGFRNPWRMSFDALNPSYLYVGDVGQDFVEEVDLVVKGGNYGWPTFEGTAPTKTKNVKQEVVDPKNPIFQYFHNQTGSQGPSVIGGYVYRGQRDPCQYGKYILGDWTQILWSSLESPVGSGKFSYDVDKRFGYQCAKGSDCRNLGAIQAFSEDDYGDIYILAIGGVHRIVEPSRCGIQCDATIPTMSKATNTFVPLDPSSLSKGKATGTSPADEGTLTGLQPGGTSNTNGATTLSGTGRGNMIVPLFALLLTFVMMQI